MLPHHKRKKIVLDELRRRLTQRSTALTDAGAASRDEATHAESRPENKYDTRALEASYLAAGQARRLVDLQRLLAWANVVENRPHARIGAGSLVQIQDDRWLLMAPSGGETFDVDGMRVEVIGLGSPLGRALHGAEADDIVEVQTPRGARTIEVSWVG